MLGHIIHDIFRHRILRSCHLLVALLGANGAGKTTTLNSVTGLIKTELGEVTEGTIEFEGKDLTRLGTEKIAQSGRALMSHPKMMLLDEPSMGLSPLLVKEIFRIIKAIQDEKESTILLVEQNAPQALDIADYGYVMENGRIVLDGAQKDQKGK